MLKAIVMTEGYFGEVLKFKSPELLQAFQSGFSRGASSYGAGSFGVLTLDDLDEMGKDELSEFDEDELKRARKLLGGK